MLASQSLGATNETGLLHKFSTKWIECIGKEWLKELEERGKWMGKLGAQKYTYIFLQFYYKFIIYYHKKIWQTLADVQILIS